MHFVRKLYATHAHTHIYTHTIYNTWNFGFGNYEMSFSESFFSPDVAKKYTTVERGKIINQSDRSILALEISKSSAS